MKSNRIEHFLFTNNLPTGLNYNTNMLLSTVYHEGAEYPFLPPLPLYTGKYKDSYPGGLETTGDTQGGEDDCSPAFTNVYISYEANLGTINSGVMRAYDATLDGYFNCLLEWAKEIGALVGVDLIVGFLENFWKFIEALAPDWDRPYLSLQAIWEKIVNLKSNIQTYYRAIEMGNADIMREIENLKLEIKRATDLLQRTKGAAERMILIQRIESLQVRIVALTTSLKKPIALSQLLWRSVMDIVSNLTNYIKFKIAPYIGGMLMLFARIPTFILDLVGTFVKILGKAVYYLALPLALAITGKLIYCLSGLCDSLDEALKNANAARQQAAQTYYDNIDNLLCGGCCDKPCEGSGSSYSKPFGLTLLLGEKYIPTFVDSMQIEPGGAQCGRKPGCPGKPNCTLYGKINGWTSPPEEYVADTWLGCGRFVTSKCGGSIYGHECACGWDDLESATCSWENLRATLTTMISSIPGIGSLYRGIGGTVGQI